MRYSRAIKESVVRKLLPAAGRSLRTVSREYGISKQMVRNWIEQLNPGKSYPSRSYELFMRGAEDRRYDSGKSGAEFANIYNDTSDSVFELAAVSATERSVIGWLSRGSGTKFDPNSSVSKIASIRDPFHGSGIYDIVVLLKHKGSTVTTYDALTFGFTSEYFKGEFDLFSKVSHGSYNDKAASLFVTLFPLDSVAKLQGFIQSNYPGLVTNWNILGAALPDNQKEMYRLKLAGTLGNSLISFLKERKENDNLRYFFDIYKADKLAGTTFFNEIYGSQRDIYTFLYLTYCYLENKPVFSGHVLRDNYDWTRYSSITPSEGAELARAALRYYTWGVEYSIPPGYSDSIPKSPRKSSNVFSYLQQNDVSGKKLFDVWMDTLLTDTQKQNPANYDKLRVTNYFEANRLKPVSVISSSGSNEVDMGKLAGLLSNVLHANNPGEIDPDKISTPYGSGNTGVVGWPLPYVKGGMDSPRTFTYKMSEQVRALLRFGDKNGNIFHEDIRNRKKYTAAQRELQKITTQMIGVEFGNPAYREDAPGSKTADGFLVGSSYPFELYKPFLPGSSFRTIPNAKAGTRFAGVDAMGFLTGSIAQTGFYEKVMIDGNGQPAKDLDAYFRMAAAGPGLDTKGKPAYDATVNGEYPLLNSRINDWNLERCTILVPDIRQIRKGDLLVRFGAGTAQEPTHVGIVIDCPDFTTAAYRDWDTGRMMNKVVVLSVSETMEQVALGTWGNTESGIYCGFSLKPFTYHIRRLVKRSSSVNPAGDVYPEKAWDVVSRTATEVRLSIEGFYESTRTGRGADIRERWMPNTGEYLILDTITMDVYNGAGTRLDLARYYPDRSYEPFIRGAEDRGYDATKSGAAFGNIYNNSPESVFEVAAVSDTGSSGVLGWLYRSPGSSGYGFVYKYGTRESDFYTATGIPNRGCSLTLNARREVEVRYNGKLMKLGLRPVSDQTGVKARPGDDLLLQIGLRAKGLEKTVVAVGTARPQDYVAVYDKKLLWRANLYIDEGMADWNNVHPWNAPPSADAYTALSQAEKAKISWWSATYGYNEWNRIFTGTEQEKVNLLTATNKSMEKLTSGDGKQVTCLLPWTRYNGATEDTEGKRIFPNTIGQDNSNFYSTLQMPNSVAYTSSRTDSPFDFNRKLLNQQYYKPSEKFPDTTFTTADQNDWFQYKKGSGTSARINTKAIFDAITTDSNGYYPYRPNYSAIEAFEKQKEGLDQESAWRAARASAGLDCNGLVNRVANYSGTIYPFNEDESFHQNSWNGPGWENGYSNKEYAENRTVELFSITTNIPQTTPERYWEFDTRDVVLTKNLVPGDLIVLYQGRYSHVMMVYKIDDEESDGKIESNKITIIESASGNNNKEVLGLLQNSGDYNRFYRVMNTNLLSSYLHNEWYWPVANQHVQTTFRFSRLKTE